MATYYALFAEQLSRPVVSVPYVDAFGTGKTKEIIIIIYRLARLVHLSREGKRVFCSYLLLSIQSLTKVS